MATITRPAVKKLLVALHVKNRDQVLREAGKILTQNGAHGVFLVNNNGHMLSGSDYPNLFDIAQEVKQMFPDYFVGTNSLDLSNSEAVVRIPIGLDGLWTDNGGIIEKNGEIYLDRSLAGVLETFSPQYFGGVAFKYLPQPKDLAGVVKEAAKHFIVTTTGDQTGLPPTVEKIETIRGYLGEEAPLALASGMSADNVSNYLNLADIFIVSTSLNNKYGNGDDFFLYDSDEIKRFREAIEK